MPEADADPDKAGQRSGGPALQGLSLAVSLVLGASGCGLFEGQHPGLRLRNDWNEPVAMYVEALDPLVSVTADPHSLNNIPLDGCKGTALVVTTSDGAPLRRFEQQACPGAIVSVSEDGTITLADE